MALLTEDIESEAGSVRAEDSVTVQEEVGGREEVETRVRELD